MPLCVWVLVQLELDLKVQADALTPDCVCSLGQRETCPIISYPVKSDTPSAVTQATPRDEWGREHHGSTWAGCMPGNRTFLSVCLCFCVLCVYSFFHHCTEQMKNVCVNEWTLIKFDTLGMNTICLAVEINKRTHGTNIKIKIWLNLCLQDLLSSFSQLYHSCCSTIDWLEQEVSTHRSHVIALRGELEDVCLRDNLASVPVRCFTSILLFWIIQKRFRETLMRTNLVIFRILRLINQPVQLVIKNSNQALV